MEFKTHHLVLLCITAFFAMAGGALITPVLPEMVGPLHTTTQGVGMLMSVFTIMLKGEFEFSSGISGIMLAVPSMACIAMAPKVRYFAARYSLIRVIIAGFILVGLSLLIMSVVHSIIGVVLLLLLFGLGLVISQTCIDAQMIQISPLEVKGGVISIYSCMRYVGQSFSPIILGIIMADLGINAVFVTAGVLGLLIAVMTYRMKYLFNNPVI